MKRYISTLAIAALSFSIQLNAESAEKAAQAQVRMAAGADEVSQQDVRAVSQSPFLEIPSQRKENNSVKSTGTTRKRVVAKAIENPPTIYGTLLYSKGYTSGMYEIPLNGGDFTKKISNIKTSYGAVLVNGKYYFPVYDSSSKTTTMNVYDLSTFTLEKSYTVSNQILASAVTYDPATDAVYGNFYNEDFTTTYFGIAHLESGKITKIAEKNKAWSAMAADNAGTIYAITTDGIVYRVKKASGALSTIGSNDITSKYVTGGVYDNNSNQIFWAVSDDNGGYMYTVNPSTGVATLATTFATEEEVSGLVIPTESTNTPGQPKNLSLSFEPNSLSGTVTFEAPTTTADGKSASGEVSYSVYANGQSLASGTTSYGATVAVPVTVSKSETYTFSVFLTNENGRGYSARAEQYVGIDTPATPSVTATYDETGNSILVQWDKITEGANGGYLDASAVKYTVSRYPGPTTIATDITENSVTDSNLGSGTIFYYTVVASVGDSKSEEGTSNKVQTNIQYPPYIENFDVKKDFTNNFTGIFSGKGDNGWVYNTKNKLVRAYYDFDYPQDEWLLTPPIKLEKGKKYRFSVDLKGGDDEYTERLEIFYGKANTLEGMTNELVKKFTFNAEDWFTVTRYIEADETGYYYIGFHACSDADQDYIYLDNIFVSAETTDNAPSAVTDITVARDPSGSNEATISMKAPSTDIAGNAISSLTKIDLYQAKSLIATITAPKCGETVSATYEVASPGTYDFMIVASNESGMGEIARKSAYIGIQAPNAPTNAKITETETLGTVLVTWDAPTTDIEGVAITAKDLTYNVATSAGTIATKLTDTQCEVKVCEPTEQKFVQLYIYAVTDGGTSASAAATDLECVGTTYETPYAESFANTASTNALGTELTSGRASWQIYSDTSISGCQSQDSDNGFLSFTAITAGSVGAAYSGRIKVSDLPNIALTLYTYPVGTLSKNTNTLDIQVNDGSGYKSVKKVVMNELKVEQSWTKLVVPMSEYVGKTIQIKFEATNSAYVYTLIDNISLGTIKAVEVTPYSISAPEVVNTDESFNITFNIANEGLKDAGYDVALYRDDEVIKTVKVDSHKSGEINIINFEDKLTRLDSQSVTYQAKIVCDGNEAQLTTSDKVVTTQDLNKLPVVTDLNGVNVSGSVELKWSEPNLSSATPEPKTDNFESYASWEYQKIGDWTLVDNDNAKVGGFKNYNFPNIPEPNTAGMSFFIVDNSWETISAIDEYKANSGTKFLGGLFNYNSEANDDWAISPLLYGGQQIISVYAKSFSSTYLESFEILYSTTDTDISSFTSVNKYSTISSDWTKYSAILPDGAKYFALRNTSQDRLMICFDDASFIPAGTARSLTVEGYNVYRDNQKITDTPVNATAYTDNIADGTNHRYNVTCVYSQGESAGSNTVDIAVSGLRDINAGNITVTVVNHDIVITGAEGRLVSIFAIGGQTIYTAEGKDNTIVTIDEQGIYLVKVGDKVFKTIIR